MQVQHDDFVIPLHEERCGQVERVLRPRGLPVATKVLAVDPNVALGEPLHIQKGVSRGLANVKRAAPEDRATTATTAAAATTATTATTANTATTARSYRVATIR